MNLFHRTKKSQPKNSAALRDTFRHAAQDPYVDWTAIIVVFIIAACVLVGIGANIYLNIGKQLAGPVTQTNSNASLPVNTSALKSILGQFDAKEMERAALLRGYSGPGDPSI